MHRRGLVLAIGAVLGVGASGCLDDAEDGSSPTPTRDPTRVTTTAGEDVRILASSVIFDEELDGPRVNYRLSNDGSADETVAVRTVMVVEGGGRHEETAYVDVPAGDEVVVEYRIVQYSALSDAEARAVRRGDAAFEVYVNGERREAF